MRYWLESVAVPGQLSCLFARPRVCTSDPRGTPALPHPVYGQTPSAPRGTAGQLCIVVNNDVHGHTAWDKQEVCQEGGVGPAGAMEGTGNAIGWSATIKPPIASTRSATMVLLTSIGLHSSALLRY